MPVDGRIAGIFCAVPVLILTALLFSASPPGAAAPASLPEPPANGEMGFIVTHFGLASTEGKEDCPDGLAGMLRENLLATLPAAEQARLSRPENEAEFLRRINDYVTGPGGTNICSNPELFDRPPHKMVQGKVSVGFDLDGASSGKTPGTCAHPNFTSPTGEPGIDNQAWRAMGCLPRFRGLGGRIPDFWELFDTSLTTGENTQLILLRGIDSLVRDDNVEVIYANSADRAIRDGTGKFTAGASYAFSDHLPSTPKRNILKGRIVHGVLEAETPRFQLKQLPPLNSSVLAARAKFDLRRVRLRMTFQPDGSAKGLVGGYQPYGDIILVHHIAGVAATSNFWDCGAIDAALRHSADGDPDPRTGKCTSISTAYDFNAVRAFVIDLQAKSRSAALDPRRSQIEKRP